MLIRIETTADVAAIASVITAAMLMLPQATGAEAAIVERLRAAGALDLSLVAEMHGEVVGYLAASPARIGRDADWALIGPLAVLPEWQRRGIGSALMAEARRRLGPIRRGIALVGDPAYYGRLGFRAFPGLVVPGCPPEVVLALPFDGTAPVGEVNHHPAFAVGQAD